MRRSLNYATDAVRLVIGLAVMSVTFALASCNPSPSSPTSTEGGTTPYAGPATTPQPIPSCAPPEEAPAAASSTVKLGPTGGLEPSPVTGDRLLLTGAVLDRSCHPMSGMAVTIWNADPAGHYGPSDETDLVCCYLSGAAATDDQGRFAVITLRPGGYQGSAGHVHVEVGEPNVGTGSQDFVVEFEGDAGLSTDQGTVIIPLVMGRDAQGVFLHAFAAFVYARS